MKGTALPIDWSRYSSRPEIVPAEARTLRPDPFGALAIPCLSDEDFALLLESVRANGLIDPLTVTEAGEVVDGQARVRAAQLVGLDTVPTRVLEAPGQADDAPWAAIANLGRRHPTERERVALLSAVRRTFATESGTHQETPPLPGPPLQGRAQRLRAAFPRAAVADQPIRTLRSGGTLIAEWLEAHPNWPPERQEHEA